MELRQDGRTFDEIRVCRAEVGINENYDGSALLEIGNTKVLVCVRGPIDLQEWKGGNSEFKDDLCLKCNLYYSNFCHMNRRESRTHGHSRIAAEMCTLIEKTFHAAIFKDFFQKSRLEVDITILQTDGSELACCINATTLAFLNAGIPIKDLVCSCTAAISYPRVANESVVETAPKYLLDVNNNEISWVNRSGCVSLAMFSQNKDLIMINLERGNLHYEIVEKLISLATEGCSKISKYMHEFLKKTTNNIKSI